MRNVGDILKFIRRKDYVVENPDLGSGSFGKTVLLKDEQLDGMRLVAKKYEPQRVSDQEEFYKHFVEEIKILLTLNHKNIVRIFNWWLYPERYVGIIMMEYIDGYDLRQYFKKFNPHYSPVTLDDIFRQIVDAFCYIESKKVIHRDIKENNILITKDGIVKIIDFGLGKQIVKIEESKRDSLNGKIGRDQADIAPDEAFRGEYSSQTDMFYIAELFSRLLHDTQKEEFFSYPDILQKMKKSNPEERYQSFEEVKQALAERDFSTITFNSEDMRIYQAFIVNLEGAIDCFHETPSFCSDPEDLIESLERIVQNNLLEEYVQRVDDFVSCFVKNKFFSEGRDFIYISKISDFLEWFRRLPDHVQKKVMSNMAYRLSKIKIYHTADDIPF